jgi:hypothetical protein
MNNKTLIYIGLIVAFAVFFVSGYYTAFLFKTTVEESKELSPEKPEELINIEKGEGLLKPIKNEYIFLGDIGKINKDKSPAEMIFYVNLNLTFSNPPINTLEKKVLLNEDTLIFVSPSLPFREEAEEEIRTPISINELKENNRAIINTKESVVLILEQEVFTAQEIKMFVSEEEYQNYLK